MPLGTPAVELQHQLPRGVYEAPYYDSAGAIVLVAVAHNHRLISWYRVMRQADYCRVWAQLETELDAQDPVRLRLEV